MLSIKNGNIPQAVVPISSSPFPFWIQLEAYSCLVSSRTSVQVMDARWALWEDGWWVRAPGGRLSQPKALWPIQKEQFCLVRIYCPGDLPFLRIPLLFQTPQIKFAHCCPKLCMIYACLGYAVSFQWFGLNAFLVHSESHSLVSFRSWYQIPWNPMRTKGLRSGPLRQVV